MKEQKKISLESLVSEIEKNGRIGRLGKVFKTEKNYYFYDTGTGKVAKLNSNVYIVLKSLLEAGFHDVQIHKKKSWLCITAWK